MCVYTPILTQGQGTADSAVLIILQKRNFEAADLHHVAGGQEPVIACPGQRRPGDTGAGGKRTCRDGMGDRGRSLQSQRKSGPFPFPGTRFSGSAERSRHVQLKHAHSAAV